MSECGDCGCGDPNDNHEDGKMLCPTCAGSGCNECAGVGRIAFNKMDRGNHRFSFQRRRMHAGRLDMKETLQEPVRTEDIDGHKVEIWHTPECGGTDEDFVAWIDGSPLESSICSSAEECLQRVRAELGQQALQSMRSGINSRSTIDRQFPGVADLRYW